jgi:3-hydroxyisobutyryl-CoA hydrolase
MLVVRPAVTASIHHFNDTNTKVSKFHFSLVVFVILDHSPVSSKSMAASRRAAAVVRHVSLSRSSSPVLLQKNGISSSSAEATPDVLINRVAAKGNSGAPSQETATFQALLNRPRALNALTLPMVRKLFPLYDELRARPGKDGLVVMKGVGGKAFCAGGDVVKVRSDALSALGVGKEVQSQDHVDFFREEYEMDYAIAQQKFRHVALLNGVTMGGGVGVSVHGRWRVATEATLVAMPETAIGFFCDVGGSYFLSRMEGQLGMWLALTGARIAGHDV